MLTTTNQILEQSKQGTILAHAIRLQETPQSHLYYLGVSSGDGQPLGLLGTAAGQSIRKWKRLAPIEEYLRSILSTSLIGIWLIPTDCAEPEVRKMLIRQYSLDKPLDYPPLDAERERLLKALTTSQRSRRDDGKAPDTADA